MLPLDLVILSLATFYCAYAISATHGPWNVFDWTRKHIPLGGLTGCLVCLSPWFGATAYILSQVGAGVVVDILAIAGASVLVWRWTGGNFVQN